MRVRAGCILIEDHKLALIERHRAGRHYFTFPGGGVDKGETPEEAAIREMDEETGLQVKIIRKIADVHFRGNLQPYFLVERISGEFGTGTGEEFQNPLPDDPKVGTYHPMWMPVSEILNHKVVPRVLTEIISRAVDEGWPAQVVSIFEEPG